MSVKSNCESSNEVGGRLYMATGTGDGGGGVGAKNPDTSERTAAREGRERGSGMAANELTARIITLDVTAVQSTSLVQHSL